MKTTAAVALSALLASSLVTALPSKRHAHGHLHNKKRDVVVVTEDVWETVYSTTTIWVDGIPTPTTEAVATTPAGGELYEQPQPSSTAAASSSVDDTPSSAAAVYTPASSTPVASSSTPASTSAVVESAAAYTPTSTATPSSSAVVSSVVSSVASSAASSAASAASTSKPSGTTYTGDITYYDPEGGYGACGWTISNSDHSVAIAHDTWDSKGTESNGNPWCGQKIEILNKVTGVTYPATVADKCMGTDALPCTGGNIDLTEGFFNEAFPSVNGRGHSDVFEWYTV